ncbi:BLUF domain-containing protein [Sediminicoccus sp. KRV36]|uniref:BLUF domain-containing protein n=1 Tax=Sediminicoccus sp. KRV36 TaxID=3133721 RepID=UPI0020102E1C|nr:BLUF domain-containing protein [Sediminicoccus rosea]UPY37404.1 BLUF domain-containing protein [Sediminicoccus rosea]
MLRPLTRLTYFSANLMRGPRWRVAEEVGALLAVARIRNAHLRITGALVVTDDCFAQILEGEAEDLDWLFRSIQADPRHCNVTLIQRALVPERAFADWAMSHVETEPRRPAAGALQDETLFQRLAHAAHGGS